MHQKTASTKDKATLCLFDLLYIDGQDYRYSKIEDRRAKLIEIFHWDDYIKYSKSFDDGIQLFDAIKAQNMEGIMCKKRESKYSSGTRSASWIKIKVQNEDTALVVGYTKGKGGRSMGFGALHLAKEKGGNYIYFGKVGTGFSATKWMEIFALLKTAKEIRKPFENHIEEENNTIWIEPIFSCKIKFASLTTNKTYREPVFLSIQKSNKNSKGEKS
jgi:bifunctional non-homologous end joining protein LigD